MKKLLKVSLVAILAAGPVAAFAGTIPAAYTDGQTVTKPTLTPSNVLATKTYVQGAYNELVQSINLEDQKVGALDSATLTAFGANTPASLAAAVNSAMAAASAAQSGVVGQIESAVGNGLTWDSTNSEIDLDASTVASLAKADSALQSTDIGSGLTWDSTTGVSLSAANQAKIDSAINKDVDNLTNYTTTTAMNSLLSGKQDTIDSTHKLSADLVDGALQSADLAGYATETYVNTKAADTLQSAKDYVDARGVVAADTWNSNTTVLVNLSSSATNN